MERPSSETEKNIAEAFFLRVSEEVKNETGKLKEMDSDKEVSKTEYKNIQQQAKRVAFLEEMKKAATFYAEASENNDAELLGVMKRYLNI